MLLSSLPMLRLGPFAGSSDQRIPRRMLLIAIQGIVGLIAPTLAILVRTKRIQTHQIYVLAVITGIVAAVDMPALQAFDADMKGTAMIWFG